MPAGFDKCIKNGGKVRTVTLSNNKYKHICIKNGKVHSGYEKEKKSNDKR